MSNALAINETMDFATIAALTGQQTGTTSGLPYLRANRAPQDDAGNPLPLGAFVLQNADGVNVYAAEERTQGKRTITVPKSIIFRPFINAYQYSIYDNDKKATINRSVIFTDFRQDAPDELGGNKCGKVTGKAKDNLSPAQKKVNDAIKCHRLLFGLVSGFTGIDAEGNEASVDDTPVLFRQGGSSFMAFNDQVMVHLNKAKRLMFTHPLDLITERVAHTPDVVGYEPRYTLDLTRAVTATKEDFDLFTNFHEYIKVQNDGIRAKYEASLKGTVTPSDAEDADYLASLDTDFDDAPFDN